MPYLVYGWVITMGGRKQKELVATLQLFSRSELKCSRQGKSSISQVLIKAEVALGEIMYRFSCSDQRPGQLVRVLEGENCKID